MSVQQDRRFLIITRKTRLQALIERFNTWPQARFYLEHSDADPTDYLSEHDHYKSQLEHAQQIVSNLGRVQLLERSFLPNYQFHQSDIIIIIGQDGLVANTLKYLNGQPVIAINPDPDRWEGRLLPFELKHLATVAEQTIEGRIDCQRITFAEARTNDGQVLVGVNDIFIGPQSHTSARYALEWHGKRECHSSSGVIVSTGFGSTGWFQSILAGAMAVAGTKKHDLSNGFSWDQQSLYFAVREPFPSLTTGTDLAFGQVDLENKLVLESMMPEQGVIFSDGIESDFLAFNAGCSVTIGISDKIGRLVMQS